MNNYILNVGVHTLTITFFTGSIWHLTIFDARINFSITYDLIVSECGEVEGALSEAKKKALERLSFYIDGSWKKEKVKSVEEVLTKAKNNATNINI